MARQPQEYIDTHREADKIEKRMARAFVKATDRMKSKVEINTIALALQGGNVASVMARIDRAWKVDEALKPIDKIRDAAQQRGEVIGRKAVARGE